jgi:ankyrin repeat protein
LYSPCDHLSPPPSSPPFTITKEDEEEGSRRIKTYKNMKEQNFPLSSQNQERLNATFASLIESINNNNLDEEEGAVLDNDAYDVNNNNNEEEEEDEEQNNENANNNEEQEDENENNELGNENDDNNNDNNIDNDDDDEDDDSNFVIEDNMDEDEINEYDVNLLNACLTAIKVAMVHKCFDLIQNLIDTCHKKNMNLFTFKDEKDGNTIIHYACRVDDDDISVLKFILQLYNKHYRARNRNHRNDIITSIRNNENDTILHTACYSGNIQIVQYIMEYFQIDNNTIKSLSNNIGATPVHIAHNKLDILKYFIHTCHIDVETTDAYHNTILHYASFNDNDEIVQYLRTVCHANELALNDDGETALPYGYDFHMAAMNGNLNNLIQCIQNDGINIEATNTHGYTALHLACRYGHLNVVDYLIQTCHVNVSTCESPRVSGYNSLHIACIHGHYNVVEYLLQQNHIHVDTKDQQGNTSLHHACRGQYIEIVQYLIEVCHADVNVRNDHEATILHCVSMDGSLEILQYLMNQYDLNVNVQDKDGKTPLHLACELGQMKVVQYLIKEIRANVNVQDKYGYTPILTAMYYGELSIVQYMIDECYNDVDLTAATKKGLDVFDFAIKANKCNDFVLYILQTFSKKSK